MSVLLKDLNDFISPSQACIKPVEKIRKKKNDESDVSAASSILEVGKEDVDYAPVATINLTDCLACRWVLENITRIYH